MSVTIEREGHRFRIKLSGDRKAYYAGTPAHAALAITHYYTAFPAGSNCPAECPLCKAIEAEARKVKAKK